MEFYIARDKDGLLYLSNCELKYDAVFDTWITEEETDEADKFDMFLNKSLFPEVTFSNSPRKVGLKLIE